MQNQRTHTPFIKSGFMSLWLGYMTTEKDLDDYLRGGFESDFGFKIASGDGPIYHVSSEGIEEIGKVLAAFSWPESFHEIVVEGARLMGWAEAATAVVFYDFKYDSDYDFSSTVGSPLSFIGVFRYLIR